MFVLIGILLGIDVLFLIIITSIPQAILTVELVELPLIVSWACVAFIQIACSLGYRTVLTIPVIGVRVTTIIIITLIQLMYDV